jgi:hypothetical protein
MQGRFYNCFTSQRDSWITFQVGLADCPHVGPERIADVINSHGPEHPFTRSTLHCEFMAEEEGTTFAVSLRSLQASGQSAGHTAFVTRQDRVLRFCGGR